MRRREFIALAGGVVAYPRIAVAQQQTKRLAFINSVAQADPAMTPFLASARQGLASQGWIEGKNLDVAYWFGINLADLATSAANGAAELHPDAILTVGPVATTAMHIRTRTIPIVFFGITDPVAAGLTNSLARPNDNVTGLAQADPTYAAKVTELLKELSPATQRVAALVDSTNAGASNTSLQAFKAAAVGLGMEPTILVADTLRQIDEVLDRFGPGPDAGFVGASGGAFITNSHDTVHAAILRNKMPAVYGNLVYADLGPVNYYIDNFDAVRTAGEYVGLILNGAKVADLPIQAPTKYILTVNMKTARLLNLTIPQSILLRADRVIE